MRCQVTWGGGGHHLDEGYVMRCQVTWGGGGHHLDEGYVIRCQVTWGVEVVITWMGVCYTMSGDMGWRWSSLG